MENFKPKALPVLIGSLPMDNHRKAAELIFEYTPDIPLWPQLPMFAKEGMTEQFMPGLPGLVTSNGRSFLDGGKETFDDEYLAFFEAYLAAGEAEADLESSIFAFTRETGKGFREFLRQVDAKIAEGNCSFTALKGQITGPVTFGTAVKDKDDRAVFYDDNLREIIIKKLAMNARYQAGEFSKRGAVPIIFIDEPSLAGFGTSAYITITREDVTESLGEIVNAVHSENGLAGVHVCANTQWDVLLESDIDIISFDAYSYFEKFILFPEKLTEYLKRGSLLAWGIVPTQKEDEIEKETKDSLFSRFKAQMADLEKIGIDKKMLLDQIFITPSCGTGSISFNAAKRVLELTRDLSLKIRQIHSL